MWSFLFYKNALVPAVFLLYNVFEVRSDEEKSI